MDYCELEHRLSSLALLGSKGTTGTQASFMELFGGDSVKIKAVEQDIAAAMGFDKVVPVSGQTYSRKMDYQVVSVLSGIAQSASKFAYDLRLLANFKEMEEPMMFRIASTPRNASATAMRLFAESSSVRSKNCREDVIAVFSVSTAVYGDGKHHDGRGEEGRQSSGAA